MTSLCYNSKRVELDCGTGAGGFKAGNTCAKGGDASPDLMGQKLVEKIKKQNPKADVAKEAVRMGVNAVVKAVRGAKIAGQYGASKTADIVRWLGSESGKSFLGAVGRTLKITGVGAIGALRGLRKDRFKILGTAIFAPQFVPFYAGASALKGFFNGAVEEYNSEGGGRQISNAIRARIGRPEFEAKAEDPKLEDVVAYLSDVLAVSIKDYIEGKEQFEITTFAEDTCPLPTQDIKVNLANRQKAIDTANYGPANPKEPNEEYWAKKAKIFGGSVREAKTMLCGNCAGFNKTSKLLGCISKGIGTDAKEVEQAGDLGYCEIFDFKCASLRTCDAWIVGGPIQDKKELSDNCGTGAGGFKEGNTCAGGGEGNQPQYIKDQIKRQEQLILNLEKKLKEPSQVEHLYAVSSNGNVILSQEGDKNSVVVEGDSIKQMQEDGNAVVTHSHPAKSSLSWADIVFASEVNLKEIRAVAGPKTYIAKRPKNGWPEKEKIIDKHNETTNRLYRILKPMLAKETKALSDNWDKLPAEKKNYSTLNNIYTKYSEFHSEALSSYVLKKLGVPFSIQKK